MEILRRIELEWKEEAEEEQNGVVKTTFNSGQSPS